MKKILLVFLLSLLKVSTSNAQSINTDFINNVDNVIMPANTKFAQQIEAFQIKKEETLSRRRNKGKNKRKSKVRTIFLNFAEHSFRVFTC